MSLSIAQPRPPSITQQPEDAVVAPGAMATFSCAASGEPLPSISWTRDEQPVVSSPQATIIGGGGTSSLTLTGVQSEVTGIYQCEAVNTEGTAVSDGAELQLASESHDRHVMRACYF